jgi:thiopurine S-methyltransferase
MDSFWFDRWREGQIGFHEGKPNASLANAIGELGTAKRVLVPLCGKAEDLAFLASRGHTVIGCELVEDAVKQFFAEHGWTPQVTRHANHVQYTHGSISVFAGDFFAVDTALIGGPCTALYDRAALVALPPELRPRYAQHEKSLLVEHAPMVLVNFEYDQSLMKGPPFSVREAEVREIYQPASMKLVEEAPDTRRPELSAMNRCWSITL